MKTDTLPTQTRPAKIWHAINADLIGVDDGAERVTTPALMLDLAAMRRNLSFMAERCAEAGLKLRPHAKTHKCPQIAHEQMTFGSVGVCCATPHEAIAMAGSGVSRILITSPVIQTRHYQELARLHESGRELMVVIDHPIQVRRWNNALAASGRPLPALVDLDIGMGRTGVRSPDDALEIARGLAESAALTYAGVQAYSGMVQHINSYDERHAAYSRQLDRLEAALAALERGSLRPDIVSGGGTGTFAIDVERGLYTESQVGSYIFMDVEYNAVEFFRGRPNPYLTSLFLRTSVVSANTPGQVTINAGFKSFATDGPLAELIGDRHHGNRYELYGDEYGRIVVGERSSRPAVGDHVDLVTPHCDPTVNLHDCYHVIEGNRVVDIWPIVARGTL